jgi:dTDP-4-amino-4,6-dideoxygalactose transaminase
MKKYNIRLMMPDVGDAELLALKDVIQSGQLVEGAKAHEFENLISEQSGAKYSVLCTSATVGLELALKALSLKPEDEVILPAFTHPATVLAVMNVGLTPVLVDVDRNSFNTNVELMSLGLSKKTKVLMPVSWGGYPIDMVNIMKFAQTNQLTVIEDAACALGTSYGGAKTGSLADMTVYSFHPRKLIALGDGGAVSTNNENIYKKLKKLKHFGSVTTDNKLSFVEPGGNYRLSNILAAMGIPQIQRLQKTIAMRTEKALYYNQLLSGVSGVKIPSVSAQMKPNYQAYCVALETSEIRERAFNQLREMGIEVQIGTYSVDLQPVCENVRKVGSLENSHFLGANLLTLPLHHHLTKQDQEIVVKELSEILKRAI